MPYRLETKVVIARIKEVDDRGIEMLDAYVNVSHKNKFRCKNCAYEWRTTFALVYRKSGCKLCKQRARTQAQIDDALLDSEAKIAEILQRNIKLMEPYKGSQKSHLFKCLIDEYEWTTTFNAVYRGHGCSICSGMRVTKSDIEKRHEGFKLRNILCLDEYKGALKKHRFLCLVSECNHEWSATFDAISRGSGCPRCSKKILTDEDKKSRSDSLLERNIQLLSEYTSANEKHWFRCLLDNHEWHTSFASVYNAKRRCPKCTGKFLTEDEKRNSEAHIIIKNRLASLFYSGVTPTKVYRNKDGKFNDTWERLIPHWLEQYKLVPVKPSKSKWHLDHIIPVSWFDPYDIEQLKLCWHHKNLQWLTPFDNISKSNKIRPQDLEVFTAWHYSAYGKASYRKPLPVC